MELLQPGESFHVRDADRYGLTRGRARHARFERPFHGVRVVPDVDGGAEKLPRNRAESLLRRARHYAPLLGPGAVFSHTTSLLLHDCPIVPDPDVHVTVPYPRRAPQHVGISGHRARFPERTSAYGALPAIDLVKAIVQSACLLPTRELVVAIDHVLNPRGTTRRLGISRDHLITAFASSTMPGVVNARKALELSREGAESRMETLLRLALGNEGIRGLELQVELHDERGFIGRFDLVERESGTIYEYDGEQHRLDRVQYLRDIERLERARGAGWRIVRFHHEDLFRGEDHIRAKLRG